VSLESSKWADVLEQNGYRCFWFAGEVDHRPENTVLVPEAHFKHEQVQWVNSQVYGRKRRSQSVTRVIHNMRYMLKSRLHDFINQFKIDLIIAKNTLTIPLNVSLGLALTETIAETQLPTIAHHHDFYWERVRFTINAVNDYIRMAFPPNLPNIRHVVINSEAQEQLAHRTGISSIIIPNVLDFENPPRISSKRTRIFRDSIDLDPDDRIILQPTRIIQRKGIEFAIDLVKKLADRRNKLVVSHEAGDEGMEYAEWLQEHACEHDVDLRLLSIRIADPLNENNGNSTASYSLWDIYPYADFITFPSLYEGFGNAFLEGIYFKKPILINRYATFVRDIEPLGFDLAVMDGYLSKKAVREVAELLESTHRTNKMVNNNYRIATRHYSYSVLRSQLTAAIKMFFGDSIEPLKAQAPENDDQSYLYIDPQVVMFKRYDSRSCRVGN